MSGSWYYINEYKSEVDITKPGLDFTEGEPRKALVGLSLTFKEIRELYESLREE